MVEKEITLTNSSGLHARPASIIVNVASKYNSDIMIIKDDINYNAKSIMSLLSMSAVKGDSLVLQVSGDDKDMALEDLVDLITHGIKD